MTDTTISDVDAKRASTIADIRAFADWLEANPWVPTPYHAYASEHLNGGDDPNPAVALAQLQEFAERADVKADESLHDRTRAKVNIGRFEYTLLVWHPNGRPGVIEERDAELARLRAEVEQLRAAAATPAQLATVAAKLRADQAPEVDICTCGIDENHAVCATDYDYDRPASKAEVALEPSGLTRAADQSRGPLAGTTPVVTYFSFGHGQTDPDTGKRLLDHYVTVVAPTYDACREAMFASRFGRAWSFDYLAGTARATEWIPRWTEHEVIVAAGVDTAEADRALALALRVLDGDEPCQGAPAGFETDCGIKGGHGPHSPEPVGEVG